MKTITVGTKIRSTKTGLEITIKSIFVDMAFEIGNVWLVFDLDGSEKRMELKKMLKSIENGYSIIEED